MGPRLLIMTVFVAVLCVVAQGLKCNYCKSIEENPNCEPEEQECLMGFNQCIKITMHKPAYGEVRRCATNHECEADVPHLVDRTCCSTNLCN